jgi:hypothetical protein
VGVLAVGHDGFTMILMVSEERVWRYKKLRATPTSHFTPTPIDGISGQKKHQVNIT